MLGGNQQKFEADSAEDERVGQPAEKISMKSIYL